jgi:hypothetical protein
MSGMAIPRERREGFREPLGPKRKDWKIEVSLYLFQL